jgi:mannose-6-phosphate isomerase-like protein (cupin superfamily)
MSNDGRHTLNKVNLREQFARIEGYWKPRIATELHDVAVKLVKIKGEFDWHHHDREDEVFLVVQGRFQMQFRDREVWVEEGELILVPHGVEHRPVAPEEAHILLIEPTSTLNTGNVVTDKTVAAPDRI